MIIGHKIDMMKLQHAKLQPDYAKFALQLMSVRAIVVYIMQ